MPSSLLFAALWSARLLLKKSWKVWIDINGVPSTHVSVLRKCVAIRVKCSYSTPGLGQLPAVVIMGYVFRVFRVSVHHRQGPRGMYFWGAW